MPREASLPPEFAALAGKVHHIQQHSPTEYSSSCPVCGDQGHTGKDWPDRFRLFVDEKVLGWCRRCGHLWFPDMADPDAPKPTREQVDAWRKEQIAREEDRKRSAERALAHLQDSERWEFYYAQLDDMARAYWERRGIPQDWQSLWRLGWDRGHRFGDFVTDVATIPLFGTGWQIRQIKYRLIDEAKGRYRYELSGVEGPAFLCDPDGDYSGHVYAIEGEIKAAVTFARLDDAGTAMIGMPGTNPGPSTLDMLRQAGRVTLVMDPNAKRDGIRLAREIGIGKTWLLVPPMKIDDGLLAQGLDRREVRNLLGGAIQLSAYVTG